MKEAFSPLVVEKAICETECSATDIIIDPFCGSGTVPLSASLKGITTTGIEVNPFLAFVADTKLLQPSLNSIERGCLSVIAEARRGKQSPLEGFSTFTEGSDVSKWLFNIGVIRAFQAGWEATSHFDQAERNVLRLALLGSAMDTCNATRDGKCLRYRKNWRIQRFDTEDFVGFFRERISAIKSDVETSFHSDNKATITIGDCRHVIKDRSLNKFKLCITSPPYLNSFDYTDIYRPELFLGQFVTSNEELRALRLRTLRSHVQALWDPPTKEDFGLLYSAAMERIYAKSELLWDKRLTSMIQAYFEDISNILYALRRIARNDASLWLVVSTSAYAGVEVPVDLIIAEIGSKAGWFLKEVGVLRYLRTSSHHWQKWDGTTDEKPRLRESVIILTAAPV